MRADEEKLRALEKARQIADQKYEAGEWSATRYLRTVERLDRELKELPKAQRVPKVWSKVDWIRERKKLGLENPMREWSVKSRADFEAGMDFLEEQRARASRAFTQARIDGFQHRSIQRMCDRGEQILKGKLMGLRMRIEEQEMERRNSIQVRELGDGTIQRFAAGEWVDSSLDELKRLQDATGKEFKQRRVRKGTEDWEESEFKAPKWTKVTREEGQLAAKAGEVVRWNDDGSTEVQD